MDGRVTDLTTTGQDNPTFTDTIPAGSRKTYDMSEVYPGGGASILVESLSEGKPIMVERAIYFGGRSGGHDTVGFQY